MGDEERKLLKEKQKEMSLLMEKQWNDYGVGWDVYIKRDSNGKFRIRSSVDRCG